MSKKQANTVLRNRRAVFGKSIQEIQKKWSSQCDFDSVEAWDEFKDELEESNLPEKEVDRLERCT